MKRFRIVAVTCFLALGIPLRGEIRPSFSLEACSWFATHVVVVSEGKEIDGEVVVLESWKGDVDPGQVLSIPELAAFSTEPSRAVIRAIWDAQVSTPHVTGDRMVLFLKEGPRSEVNDGHARDREWVGANHDDINVSVLWIEGEKPFGLTQVMNPGDSVMVSNGESENAVRTQFFDIDKTHRDFDRAFAIEEPAARAEALESFAFSDLFVARTAAFAALQECGRPAVPVLKNLLHDFAKLTVHDEAILALAEIGGDDVGEELTNVVREERKFWNATAPRLKESWWNAIDEPGVSQLRERYGRVHAALYGLRKLKFPGCRNVVTEFRDCWRSLPRSGNRGEPDQISQSCDDVLNQLP